MKNTELRIGNLVYALKSTPNPVVIGNDYNIYLNRDYSPIPLSKKWLMRFGFECRVVYGNNHWLKNQILIFEDKKGKFEFAWGLKIKSVHQLQNIYFALTGKELKE